MGRALNLPVHLQGLNNPPPTSGGLFRKQLGFDCVCLQAGTSGVRGSRC
jgi:hypothetical protein